MRSHGYQSMEDATTINMDELTFLIIGKTGNGKSSLGNIILGKRKFQVSTSMASETTQMSEAVGAVNGEQIKVVDTPDPVNLGLSKTEISAEVARWKSHAVGKFVILLAVRCDVRYTAEEYDIYTNIKIAWGDNSFTDRLVVVFTFGDRQDRDIHEELKTVCWELRSVLDDAGNRYVIFNDPAHDNELEKHKLMEYARAPVVPPPSPNLISPRLLLIILVVIIAIIALWFGLRWTSNILKTPVFLLVFLVILIGVIAFVYRRQIFPFINIAMLINILPFIVALILTPLKVLTFIGK